MQRLHVTRVSRKLCQLTGPCKGCGAQAFVLCVKTASQVKILSLTLCILYSKLHSSVEQWCMQLLEVEVLASQNAMLIIALVPNVKKAVHT